MVHRIFQVGTEISLCPPEQTRISAGANPHLGGGARDDAPNVANDRSPSMTGQERPVNAVGNRTVILEFATSGDRALFTNGFARGASGAGGMCFALRGASLAEAIARSLQNEESA